MSAFMTDCMSIIQETINILLKYNIFYANAAANYSFQTGGIKNSPLCGWYGGCQSKSHNVRFTVSVFLHAD